LYSGRTYTLSDHQGDSSGYFQLIRDLADRCLEIIPGDEKLRAWVRDACSWWRDIPGIVSNRSGSTRVIHILEESLSPFLTGIDEHLKHLSLAGRLDRILRMRRKQYFLSMLEIELTNRINADQFRRASWKMALIAHCLRDYHSSCSAMSGEIEEQCAQCNEKCFVSQGSGVMERFGVTPYISVTMDHRRLLGGLREEHPDMGVLGIACVPELVAGLRLCERMDIPAVGVPLDVNRCSRWMGRCLETTFNLQELVELVKPGSRV
jgi:hypothetical protein